MSDFHEDGARDGILGSILKRGQANERDERLPQGQSYATGLTPDRSREVPSP